MRSFRNVLIIVIPFVLIGNLAVVAHRITYSRHFDFTYLLSVKPNFSEEIKKFFVSLIKKGIFCGERGSKLDSTLRFTRLICQSI